MTEISKNNLLILAARCELELPSRGLDYDIWLATSGKRDENLDTQGFAARGVALVYNIKDDDRLNWFNVPAYTTSLDAAATLSTWMLISASDIEADGLPAVRLGDPSPRQGIKEVLGLCGRTLALTWCAAALKARAALLES